MGVELQGNADEGFAGVRAAFQRCFDEHGDVGAAVCVYVDGRPVVDLWGGVADQRAGTPWSEDTLQLVFSTTKGLAAITALTLVQDGLLDLDAPVSSLWPELRAGAGGAPIRWLFSHRMGLPVLDGEHTMDELLDWSNAVAALEATSPIWEPGSAHGYHAITYGWLVGEVVRRATGRSLGAVFQERVARPLGLDAFIGLPASEEARVSRLVAATYHSPPAAPEVTPAAEVDTQDTAAAVDLDALIAAYTDPGSLTQRALNLVPGGFRWNRPEVHAAELPAANGIGTARSLARAYAATVGEVDGVRLLSGETVARATEVQSDGPDRVVLVPMRFGIGFQLATPTRPLSGPRAFGHGGAGGSLAFADPDRRLGFCYVMNQMQEHLGGVDPRADGLVKAVVAALG